RIFYNVICPAMSRRARRKLSSGAGLRSAAFDRLRARRPTRPALGPPAGEGREALEDEAGVGDRLAPDLEQRVRHRPGPMRREDEALDLARRIVGRRRLRGKDL